MDAAGIRRQIAAERAAGRGRPGKGFAAEVREQAVAYAARRRAQGVSQQVLATELGLAVTTLENWRHQSAHGAIVPGFRAVQLAHEHAVEVVGSGVVVHGAHGVRIEGLDVAQLAELLRRLA